MWFVPIDNRQSNWLNPDDTNEVFHDANVLLGDSVCKPDSETQDCQALLDHNLIIGNCDNDLLSPVKKGVQLVTILLVGILLYPLERFRA